MTIYTIETRIILKDEIATDDEAKMQIATVLHLLRLCVEEGSLAIDGVELGLLRDDKTVDLPTEAMDLLHPDQLRKEN